MKPNEQLPLFNDSHKAEKPSRPANVTAPSRPSCTAPGSIIVPTPPPPSLPDGAQWRETPTALQKIGFILMRSRRKSIGLQVNDDGLRVTAPGWVSLKQIDAAVNDKASWILAKIRHHQARKEKLHCGLVKTRQHVIAATSMLRSIMMRYCLVYPQMQTIDGCVTPHNCGYKHAPKNGLICELAISRNTTQTCQLTAGAFQMRLRAGGRAVPIETSHLTGG
jgi:hypothetical protein